MSQKVKALGYKHSKGQLENGTPYDFVVLYTIMRMETKANQRGAAGAEIRGFPELTEKLEKIPFNGSIIEIEVEIESIAIGKGEFKQMVVDVILPPAAKAA